MSGKCIYLDVLWANSVLSVLVYLLAVTFELFVIHRFTQTDELQNSQTYSGIVSRIANS